MAENQDKDASEAGERFDLEEDEELRVSCESNSSFEVQLIKGFAEIHGSEMVRDKKYKFTRNVSIYTFNGCSLQVFGVSNEKVTKTKETPAMMYLNVHASLEQFRKNADESSANGAPEESWKKGPNVLVVGPTDVGKTTLCKTLLNYAVRMGRRPVYVDLDVGQGSISVPGTMGALVVEDVSDIQTGGFHKGSPLVYSYGHKTPGHNSKMYCKMITNMAQKIRSKMGNSRKSEVSGTIINTCGWIRGEGYTQIKHIAQAFEADVIVVLDSEKLYQDLKQDMPTFVEITWLPKAEAVVERSGEVRIKARQSRIRDYFYGHDGLLEPHRFDVKIADIEDRIYRVDNKSRIEEVDLTGNAKEAMNHLVAVSFAKNQDELLDSNIAGFVCIVDSDEEKGKITVLSPQPKPLPDTLLLVSDVQYNG